MNTGDIIKSVNRTMTSGQVYEGEDAIEKLALVMAFNGCPGIEGSRKINIERFQKTRCKYGKKKGDLTDEQIIDAENHATEILKTALEADQQALAELAQKEHVPDEVVKEARDIYESGGMMEYCRKAYAKVWYGDEFVLDAVLYVLATLYVTNADIGLMLFVTGNTQDGKSLAVKKALLLAPPSNYRAMKMSPMYPFYARKSTIHEKMVIFSDDTTLPPETAELYRVIISSWHDGSPYGVVKKQDGIELRVPPRISLILTGIDSVVRTSDEAQDESRFLTIEIRRTDDQRKKIKRWKQEGDRSETAIQHEIQVIRVMWSFVEDRIIPQHKIIEDDYQFRDDDRYRTMMKAHALLCGRSKTTDKDIEAIQEFMAHTKPMMTATSAALLRNEQALYDSLDTEWNDVKDVQEFLNVSPELVYRAARGKGGSWDRPTGGLLAKCKDVQVREVTELRDKQTVKKHQIRRTSTVRKKSDEAAPSIWKSEANNPS